MIVLDTHALIWWSDQPERLSARARRAIEDANRIGVATMSVMEIAMLVQLGRLELDRPLVDWLGRALADERSTELPLTAGIAASAGAMDGPDVPPDPSDRIIYATARAHEALLVTRDHALRALDPERTLW